MFLVFLQLTRSLSDLQIFCWKVVVGYLNTNGPFWCCRTSFLYAYCSPYALRLLCFAYKKIDSVLKTTEKTGKKKHDKNEREDWRTEGEFLINPLSFTQLDQLHGVPGFPAIYTRSRSHLQIFCWKSSTWEELDKFHFGGSGSVVQCVWPKYSLSNRKYRVI